MVYSLPVLHLSCPILLPTHRFAGKNAPKEYFLLYAVGWMCYTIFDKIWRTNLFQPFQYRR